MLTTISSTFSCFHALLLDPTATFFDPEMMRVLHETKAEFVRASPRLVYLHRIPGEERNSMGKFQNFWCKEQWRVISGSTSCCCCCCWVFEAWAQAPCLPVTCVCVCCWYEPWEFSLLYWRGLRRRGGKLADVEGHWIDGGGLRMRKKANGRTEIDTQC